MSEKLTAWDRVSMARDLSRPTALDYIENIFDTFIELHGDRQFKDDASIVCGLATLEGRAYTIIAEQKGRNTKENIERNFGMPNPESYRKALRFMKQAEKFHRPIITFVDTKGAYPGIGAEERGQGEAIARNLMEMSNLKVPILVFVIGEGSSRRSISSRSRRLYCDVGKCDIFDFITRRICQYFMERWNQSKRSSRNHETNSKRLV